MYPLGKQFEVNYKDAQGEPKAIYKGTNYRITIITERVVRLEYSPEGKFVDEPTQLIQKRNLGYPEFKVNQDTNFIEITTKYFKLTYVKRQPFSGTKVDPMKNLKITLMAREKDRQRDWYYNHPEARNMNGNLVSIDVPGNEFHKHS